MKNILFFLTFSCLSLISYGQIKLNSNLETGYESRELGFYDPEYIDYHFSPEFKNNMYTNLELNSEFKGIIIYTNNKTYFIPRNFFKYEPVLAEYKIGAKYNYKHFTFGYEHMCSHSLERKYFTEGYDRFFVNFKFLNKEQIEDKLSYKIKFNGSFETGYEDKKLGFNNPEYVDHYFVAEFKNNLYGILELTSEFKGFSVYINNKTYFFPENLLNYNPMLTEYKIGTKYDYKRFTLGYEHMSSHSLDRDYFTEAYDRFFINIKFFDKKQTNSQ
ncbi:MAG: hypothetical protein AABY32_07035 [Nanoarchaeota archaeon]